MSLGINLHNVVRPAISLLYPEVSATLYQSIGQAVAADGDIKSAYAPGLPIMVQMQSESPTILFHADRVGQEEISRKLYLFSGSDLMQKVAGIIRPLGRGGDMLLFDDGTWWLINATIEDFTRSGWVCVRVTLQVNPPDLEETQP